MDVKVFNIMKCCVDKMLRTPTSKRLELDGIHALWFPPEYGMVHLEWYAVYESCRNSNRTSIQYPSDRLPGPDNL